MDHLVRRVLIDGQITRSEQNLLHKPASQLGGQTQTSNWPSPTPTVNSLPRQSKSFGSTNAVREAHSGDLSGRCNCLSQHVPVVKLVPTQILANDTVAASCCRYGHLRKKLVSLVSLVFTDRHHVRFLQTAQLSAVRSYPERETVKHRSSNENRPPGKHRAA